MVREVPVEVRPEPDLTLESTELARRLLLLDGDEADARHTSIADDDLLAVDGPFHQVRQMRLGLGEVDLRRHVGTMAVRVETVKGVAVASSASGQPAAALVVLLQHGGRGALTRLFRDLDALAVEVAVLAADRGVDSDHALG